jgi:hypothetical protein
MKEYIKFTQNDEDFDGDVYSIWFYKHSNHEISRRENDNLPVGIYSNGILRYRKNKIYDDKRDILSIKTQFLE